MTLRRETDNDRLPPQVLSYFVVTVLAELNFLRAGGPIIRAAGPDAWLAVALGALGIATSVFVIVTLIKMFPDQTLVEIAQGVLGRVLGMVVIVLYIGYWLTRSGLIVHLQSHLYSRQLLPQTPEILLSLYMIVLSTYFARHGLEPMARLFWVLVVVFVLSIAPVVVFGVGSVELGRLKPVLVDGILPVLHGGWLAFVAASGVGILLMVGPFLTSFQGAMRSALFGVLIIAITAMMLIVLLVTRFGHVDAGDIVWATMVLVESIEIPGFTGFRLDPIFLTVWSLLIFGTVAVLQYCAISALRRLFGLHDNLLPALGTGLAIAGISMLPIPPPDLLHLVEVYSQFVVPFIVLGFPSILLVTARLRGHGVRID